MVTTLDGILIYLKLYPSTILEPVFSDHIYVQSKYIQSKNSKYKYLRAFQRRWIRFGYLQIKLLTRLTLSWSPNYLP